MYSIVMQNDKSLRATQKTTLYQREKLVDKIQFLIPPKYEELNLSDFSAILKYKDQGGVAHMEILEKDIETYNGYSKYILPIDTNLTQFAGDIRIRITLSKTDLENKKQYVLHTGETVISISPLEDYYAFVTDESLEYIDQIVGNLDAKIEVLSKISETYDKEKADNITYDNNKIQLTSNGQKIGDYITIEDGGGGIIESEFDIIEF